MKIDRYSCGNGEGMYDDKKGSYCLYSDVQKIIDEAVQHDERMTQTISILYEALDEIKYMQAGYATLIAEKALENARKLKESWNDTRTP